jgi:hypothetical protein
MTNRTHRVIAALTSLVVTLVLPADSDASKAAVAKGSLVPAPAPTAGAKKQQPSGSPPSTTAAESPVTRAQVSSIVAQHAQRLGVEVALVHAIIAAESGYDTRAVSRAGALGVMQVMPATAKDYGVLEPHELFDPHVNVAVGVRHLKRLLNKYENDYGTAIMAYNAGEGAVDRTDARVAFSETLNYMEAVIRNYHDLGGKHPTEKALKKVAILRKQGDVRPDKAAPGEPPGASVVTRSSSQALRETYIRTVPKDISPETLARFGFRSARGDNAAIRGTIRRIR